jgi:hypothetical protein
VKIVNTRRRMALAVAVVIGAALTTQALGPTSASASTVPRPVIKSALTKFDSGSAQKTATAKCPSGTHVIGGGGRVNGGQHVVITREQPIQSTRDRFVVSAIEDQFGTAQFWAVEAFAICSVPLPGLEIVKATGAPGSFGFQGQNADCSPGKNVLGVGGRINGGAGQVSLNTQGRFAGHASAGGVEDTDGFAGSWSVTSYAICAHLSSVFDSQVVSVQTASDATARKIFFVDCPPGMSLTGGAAFAGGNGTVVEVVSPNATRVQLIARMDGPIGPQNPWSVTGYAICAL